MSSKKSNKRPSSSISADSDQTTLQVTKTKREIIKEIPVIIPPKIPVKIDFDRVLVELSNAALKEDKIRKNKVVEQREKAENYVKVLKSKSTHNKKYEDLFITKSNVTSINPKYINAWNEERKEILENKLKLKEEGNKKPHIIPPHIKIPKDEPIQPELSDIDHLRIARREKQQLIENKIKSQTNEEVERQRILYRWKNYYIDDPKLNSILV